MCTPLFIRSQKNTSYFGVPHPLLGAHLYLESRGMKISFLQLVFKSKFDLRKSPIGPPSNTVVKYEVSAFTGKKKLIALFS